MCKHFTHRWLSRNALKKPVIASGGHFVVFSRVLNVGSSWNIGGTTKSQIAAPRASVCKKCKTADRMSCGVAEISCDLLTVVKM